MQPSVFHIFVSSTWLDLQLERVAVETALQRLRETKFMGMEYFGSRDEDTRRARRDRLSVLSGSRTWAAGGRRLESLSR
jgi:hypothetical protein